MQLVADIGGTNSRFALCEPGSINLLEPRKFPNKEYDSLQSVLSHYLEEVKSSPEVGCLAVAGPVHGDRVELTNIDWQFRISELRDALGLARLTVTNDFTALAMSIPHLSEEAYDAIGGGAEAVYEPKAVLGPGTGLGVSGLIWTGNHWSALKGEGGNTGFSPVTDIEIALLQRAMKDKSFVRTEDFVSGNGLTYLHQLLQEIEGRSVETLSASEITWRASTSAGDDCKRTVDVFCGMLGHFAGNVALTLGALGGVYIGGGVAPQLGDLFVKSPFRPRFEAKGPFTEYVRAIPTYLLHSHSRNALIGAAALLRQSVTDKERNAA